MNAAMSMGPSAYVIAQPTPGTQVALRVTTVFYESQARRETSVVTLQENSKVAEDDDDERNDNVTLHGPNSHSECKMYKSVGNIDVLNICLTF